MGLPKFDPVIRVQVGRIAMASLGIWMMVGYAPASAQDAEAGSQLHCLSWDLPVDHWGVEALKRMEALGQVDVQIPTATVQACTLRRSLEQEGIAPSNSGFADLRGDWSDLLAAEQIEPVAGQSWHRDPVRARLSLEVASGRTAPGFGEFAPDRTGAIERPDAAALVGDLASAVRVVPGVWGAGRLGFDRSGLRVEQAEAKAHLGPIAVTAGRGAAAFGYAARGSMVLSRASRLDRIELASAQPFSLPSWADRLGTLTFSTLLAELHDPRHPSEPFFWGARGSLRPHPRVTFAINRAAMFDGGENKATTGKVLNMVIGRVAGIGFENQIVSLEGRVRLPTDSIIPVTAYFEWGAEDAAGAWWDVPGRIVGVYFPGLPGLSHTSLALEYASFGESCCFNPEWYRHWSFPGSWAVDEAPLGHALGGHGTELLARTTSYGPHSIRLTHDFFIRSRGIENLFVPGREGQSVGFSTHLEWRVASGFEVSAEAGLEDGSGWSERAFHFGGRYFY